MNSQRAARYWRDTFGLSAKQYGRPGIVVCPHPAKLAGRNACWILLREGTCVICAPGHLTKRIQDRTLDVPVEPLLSEQGIQQLFGNGVQRLVGPSYQGYAEHEDFRPASGERVRRLRTSDQPALSDLIEACDPDEWDDSGLALDSDPLFGWFDSGILVSVGGIIPWASYAANPGVITHPDHRGRGFGAAVTSAAMEHILGEGKVVLFQTLEDNRAAVRIAETLGCKAYARMLYVGLKGNVV